MPTKSEKSQIKKVSKSSTLNKESKTKEKKLVAKKKVATKDELNTSKKSTSKKIKTLGNQYPSRYDDNFEEFDNYNDSVKSKDEDDELDKEFEQKVVKNKKKISKDIFDDDDEDDLGISSNDDDFENDITDYDDYESRDY